jgi:hypothetical protein
MKRLKNDLFYIYYENLKGKWYHHFILIIKPYTKSLHYQNGCMNKLRWICLIIYNNKYVLNYTECS